MYYPVRRPGRPPVRHRARQPSTYGRDLRPVKMVFGAPLSAPEIGHPLDKASPTNPWYTVYPYTCLVDPYGRGCIPSNRFVHRPWPGESSWPDDPSLYGPVYRSSSGLPQTVSDYPSTWEAQDPGFDIFGARPEAQEPLAVRQPPMRVRPPSYGGEPPQGGILPLSDPRFSVREACIQAALLERHLSDPQQRCSDCISKHFLTMEGYLTEALQLGPPPELRQWIEKAIPHVRWCAYNWRCGMPEEQVIHGLRDIRKMLVDWCFDAAFTAPLASPGRDRALGPVNPAA